MVAGSHSSAVEVLNGKPEPQEGLAWWPCVVGYQANGSNAKPMAPTCADSLTPCVVVAGSHSSSSLLLSSLELSDTTIYEP